MGQVASTLSPEVGATVLFVLKLEPGKPADRITLYMNPTVGEPEPEFGIVKEDTNFQQFEALVVYSTGEFSIDELRVGDSFSAVVPGG
jgi:hypothetical protein